MMTGEHSGILHRIHTTITALDHELLMVWQMLPHSGQQWLRARRSALSITAVIATNLAAGPAWLPVIAVYLYVAQHTPRHVRSAATPLLVGGLFSTWLGSVGTGLGLATIDSGDIIRSAVLSSALIAAVGIAEVQLHAYLANYAPATVGLGTKILLGRRGYTWITAPAQVAALVIGPPRSGKTSGVVIPNVMAWSGPVLTTSTRRDVLEACAGIRATRGNVWCFEPLDTGRALPPGVRRLDWTPVRGCTEWDTALDRGRALMAGAAQAVEGADHWRARGAQLLGALLHAAALAPLPMSTVCDWVHANRLDPAQHILSRQLGDPATHVLDGIATTPDRERGSIWSAVAGSLAAFDSAAVIASADRALNSDFDPATWLDRDNSLFIVAPADQATSIAPLVVGLVEEVRIAALRRTDRHGPLLRPLLLALDEVANISPLPALPQIASEGGGRNIILLAATQDLSQLRTRWGNDVATGMLTLAGAKLVLPGVADSDTLDRIEKLCGKEWFVHESTTSSSLLSRNGSSSRHHSLVEEPVHAAADIRGLRPGTALALVGGERPVVVDLATHHTTEPFRTWTRQHRTGD